MLLNLAGQLLLFLDKLQLLFLELRYFFLCFYIYINIRYNVLYLIINILLKDKCKYYNNILKQTAWPYLMGIMWLCGLAKITFKQVRGSSPELPTRGYFDEIFNSRSYYIFVYTQKGICIKIAV